MMFKKVLALAMSLCMVFAMSATAFADSGDVTNVNINLYKSDGVTTSMGQGSIDTSRQATVTEESDGTFTLSIPIKKTTVSNLGQIATGYISQITYSGITSTASGNISSGTYYLTLSGLTTNPTNQGNLDITCTIDLTALGIHIGGHTVSAKMAVVSA